MRVALTKGSLLIPPTYFALAHARVLADRHTFRFFTGAAHIVDPAARATIEIEDTLARHLPVADSWPVRRREQAGALLASRTARDIRSWNPDVIHQHFAYGSAAAAAARDETTPLITTVHGGDAFVPMTPASSRTVPGRLALARLTRQVRRAFAESDRILAVSRYIADVAVNGGAPPERIRVHYQGIDTDFFTPAPTPAPRADVPVVLFVGRIVETKGVFDLLEASVQAVQDRPHALTFLGEGSARARLEAAAATHSHVRVLGGGSAEQVREEMRQAHVVVLPTRLNGIAREAAGLVLLEAQACGAPVLAYDSGGTAEMLRDGDTGWLVAEGDVAALTDRLREALDMTVDERAAIGARARGFVTAERSLTASAEELEAIYRDVVA
ncbi:glycosyltransferase [Microbacterium sp. zg.Y909]|uniref:glycosyltransferase n=1 Tax=Microbacterium sp. zg.Y909 TaxID=2969413 RepID=UPI00214AE530|nr:glycosyltransferase [Microbacterium sp. zg.Y909]MCR2824038.1 glycosyltransferase [Microbacterium sp. zg.Y909]